MYFYMLFFIPTGSDLSIVMLVSQYTNSKHSFPFSPLAGGRNREACVEEQSPYSDALSADGESRGLE